MCGDSVTPPRMTPARQRVLEVADDGLARSVPRPGGRRQCHARRGARADRGRRAGAPPNCRNSRRSARPIPISRATELNDRAGARGACLARCGRRTEILRPVCWMASPAPARPKSISRRWPRRCARTSRSLILLPEIALTVQFLERFAERFGVRPAEWHSRSFAEGAPPHLSRGDARARRAWWWARARRCSCRSRNSASSSSMKNMSRPTSRKTAPSITPATWRWCAAASRIAPWCWPAPRRRWKAYVNAHERTLRAI